MHLAFSFLGVSTRVEIYAPPGQRHKVPATYRGGDIGHRVLINLLDKLFNFCKANTVHAFKSIANDSDKFQAPGLKKAP